MILAPAYLGVAGVAGNHGCVDDTRAYCIHADALCRHIRSNNLADSDDGEFRCAITGLAADGKQACAGRQVDDRSAVLAQHDLKRIMSSDARRAPEAIRRAYTPEVRLALFQPRVIVRKAWICHERVQIAETHLRSRDNWDRQVVEDMK